MVNVLKTTVAAKVDPDLKARLIRQAYLDGKNVNIIICDLIEKYLKENEPNPGGDAPLDLKPGRPLPTPKPKKEPEPEPYTCGNCGAVVNKGDEICSKCGVRLDWGSVES